jgi:hypothetical protein
MQLQVHSATSYLNEIEARSCVGRHLFMTNNAPKEDIDNGAILNPTGVLNIVVSSAAEAKVNAKEAEVIRTTLEELGHKQQATTIITDNTTAHGIVNNCICQNRS